LSDFFYFIILLALAKPTSINMKYKRFNTVHNRNIFKLNKNSLILFN